MKLNKTQIKAIHIACESIIKRTDVFSCTALCKASQRTGIPDLRSFYKAFFDPPSFNVVLWGVKEDYLGLNEDSREQRLIMLLLFAETGGEL